MGGAAADNFNSKHVKILNIAKKGIKLSVIIKKLRTEFSCATYIS